MNTIIILLTGICYYLYLLSVLLQNKRGRYGLIIGYFATLVMGYFIVGKPIVIFNLVFIFYDVIFGRMVEGLCPDCSKPLNDSEKAKCESIENLNKTKKATNEPTDDTCNQVDKTQQDLANPPPIKKNNIHKSIAWCEKFNISHQKFIEKSNIFLPITHDIINDLTNEKHET